MSESRPAPLAYRVPDAAAAIGLGKSKIWALIAEGRQKARKIGSATVIRHEDLQAFLDARPEAPLAGTPRKADARRRDG